jgi:hypothetical protein
MQDISNVLLTTMSWGIKPAALFTRLEDGINKFPQNNGNNT